MLYLLRDFLFIVSQHSVALLIASLWNLQRSERPPRPTHKLRQLEAKPLRLLSNLLGGEMNSAYGKEA